MGSAAGTIALTFDDGPDPTWTAEVLRELRRADARATFFVEARRALEHSELIEAMGEAGHEVGFHCLDHIRHSERAEAEIAADAELGLAMLASIGVRPSAWRTPWGVVTGATRRVAAEHGLEICGWSLDSHDWRGDSSEQMLAALAGEGGLRDGAVVLMHDGLGPGALRGGCAETVALAEALLADSDARGLRAATVSRSSVRAAA